MVTGLLRQFRDWTTSTSRSAWIFVRLIFRGGGARYRGGSLICAFDLERRTVVTFLDGQQLQTVRLPHEFKLEIVGAPDANKDKQLSFANYSNGSVFTGYADNLVIFGRALDAVEIKRFYDKSTTETRKGWKPT